MVCFGISANAQKYVKITGVQYSSNKIIVNVALTEEGKRECASVDFKVVPKKGAPTSVINDGVKYGQIRSGSTTSVTFGCGEEDKEKAQQCRLYDFDIIDIDYEKKKN